MPNELERSAKAGAGLEKETAGDKLQRVKLLIAYDGAPFRGWQSQANADTIQDRIESAFTRVTGAKIRVHGAGRTDTGVHALGQCAHADVPARKLPLTTWRNALNASLPSQIRIVDCRSVSKNFHARFSARGKVYRYRITTTAILSPFEVHRAWHVTAALDDAALRTAAGTFVGTHDFSGFCANRGPAPNSTIRTIRRIKLRRTSALTLIEFDGDGFLYKMVRLMVGAIVRCATNKETVAEVQRRLSRGERRGARLVAPAAGLTLLRVRY